MKNLWGGVMLAGLAVVISGCSSTAIEMTAYTEDKARVDQEMEAGNAGYLVGTPQPADRSQLKKTRRTYVLEISKGPADVPAKAGAAPDSGYSASSLEEPVSVSGRPQAANLGVVTIPPLETIERKASRLVSYTVEKDDTLQKISKKFYDTYAKWSRIYEANKDVIKNPDRIKPGTVLQIPVD